MKRLNFYLATILLCMLCCANAWGGNTINYTSSDGVVNPYNSSAFGGAQIVSNTCTDGQGTIVFDKDLTEIGNSAFSDCSSLTSVTLPESVTEIGAGAFERCISLTSVTIPEGVTMIDFYAFSDCKSLTSIKIPESVTKIGMGAFERCISLTSVTIPEGVTMIDIYAFYNCVSLTSVTLPESVTKIGDFAFDMCKSLTSVTVNWATPLEIDAQVFNIIDPSDVTLYVPAGTAEAYKSADVWKEFNIVEQLDSKRVIYYTSSSGVVGPDNSAFGGAQIVSNTCTDGQGTIVFDKDLTEIGYNAFYDCKSLESITLPESVTTIGERAFYDCASLTSVTLPEGVTTIGERAFRYCSSLESINIPKSVTTIGKGAFDACSSLESITVDSENEVYDSRNDCNAIIETATNTLVAGCATTVIPEDVTTIGYNAFYDCTSLESINLPESLKSIGASVFQGCTSLKSINIPEGVTKIDIFAFSDCASLTSVTLPESVTEIGNWAFDVCKSLTSVTVNWATPLTFSEYVFGGIDLSGITLYVPAGTAEAYKSADVWKEFNIVEQLDSKRVIYYTSTEGVVGPDNSAFGGAQIVSNTYENGQGTIVFDRDLTTIGKWAFEDLTSLTSITLPESVTKIGGSAFEGCTSLTSITLPEGVTEIGYRAFYECSSLESINIPKSVTVIDVSAFQYCKSLTSVTLPESLKSIGVSVFQYCKSLTSINIPESVTKIGEEAFYECSSLESINIPESVTDIDYCAFGSCKSLTSVTVNWATPLTVTSGVFYEIDLSSVTLNVPFGTSALYRAAKEWKEFNIVEQLDSKRVIYYTSTEGVVGPDNSAFGGAQIVSNTCTDGQGTIVFDRDLTTIGEWAFYDCASLTSVTLPEGVTTIGEGAFGCCSSLTSINIPESVTEIGECAFGGCSSLTSITLPESVTTIGRGAFEGCISLESVTIPESVTTIGYNAFYDCTSLESITLPESVTEIGDLAFSDCSSLKSINIPEGVTNIGNYAFENCTSLKNITVNWATPLTVTSGVFAGIDLSDITLYVPAGTTKAYKSADVWKEFNIVDAGFYELKSAAIGSLAAIVGDINDEDITHMLNKYISQIQSATSATKMISAQTEGEEMLTAMVKLYHRLNVDLPSKGTTGHGVRVILEEEGETDKVLELMNPSRVEFFKR